MFFVIHNVTSLSVVVTKLGGGGDTGLLTRKTWDEGPSCTPYHSLLVAIPGADQGFPLER